METKYITLSVRRLETPVKRMEREYKDMALRAVAGAVVALCVAAIVLAWYGIAASKEIIDRSKRYTEPEPTVQVSVNQKILTATRLLAVQEEPEAQDGQVKSEEEELGNDLATTSQLLCNPSPLTDEEWRALLEVCEETRIAPSLALGLIQVESSFRADTVSKYGDYGYCQLNPRWHPACLTPVENIRYGIGYLAECIERYDNLEAGLTAYNAGRDTGSRVYADKVLAAAEGWRMGGKTWND